MPWYLIEELEDFKVVDPPLPDFLDELSPISDEATTV